MLFICVHNTARSQLAEAFLRLHGGDGWDAQSAGLEPGYLNPYVVDYLEERGIGIRGKTPRSVFEVYRSGATFDWVVTVCDPSVEARCPVFPGPVARQTWPFPDPWAFSGSKAEVRNQIAELAARIEQRVQQFLVEVSQRRVS